MIDVSMFSTTNTAFGHNRETRFDMYIIIFDESLSHSISLSVHDDQASTPYHNDQRPNDSMRVNSQKNSKTKNSTRFSDHYSPHS